jgi:hypothetical protein
VGVFEDLGRGLGGGEENTATVAKKETTLLFGGKTNMIFFLKNENLGFFWFLSCVFCL